MKSRYGSRLITVDRTREKATQERAETSDRQEKKRISDADRRALAARLAEVHRRRREAAHGH